MNFEIPVTIFLFRRTNTLKDIFARIATVKPSKMYIIADGGRNDIEHRECIACREYAESLIDWDCDIIRNYSDSNRGVYKNIGEGAKWVFAKEKYAIFLEDDNLPEISFFEYCRELLYKYEKENRVLWICGTNYLESYKNKNDDSYMFTKHMLPCGWASWSYKFLKYYDGEIAGVEDKKMLKNFKKSYLIKGCKARRLYKSHLYHVKRSRYLVISGNKEASWDYQMNYAVRANGLYGISPCKNQIKNIGVDDYSIHGGNNMAVVSTHCGMDSIPLIFPLKHPNEISVDVNYEKLVNKSLRPSLFCNISHIISMPIKRILGLNSYDSLSNYIKMVKKNQK